MYKVRIAIEPRLRYRFGPEICWVWRMLLSGMGWPWEEVPWNGATCDIAYGTAESRRSVPSCRLFVLADRQAWEERTQRRLISVEETAGWQLPRYVGQPFVGEVCAELTGLGVICRRDLVFDCFWLVTGQEERSWIQDRHGFVDLRGTAWVRQQIFRQALASGIGVQLERLLTKLGLPQPVQRWPLGKRAAVGLGHDVDYPDIVRWVEPFRMLRHRGWRGIRPAAAIVAGGRTHWHFASWVGMERAFDVHSAFFFVPRQGSLWQYATGTPDSFYDVRSPRFRALFQYLIDEGCEIGMHASYKAYESCHRLAHERRILEETCGRVVNGNRHHYWHLNSRDPEETLKFHEEIGLKYDTSLGHERYVGWRRGMTWPFFPFHQQCRRQMETLQIATAWMDAQLFRHRRWNPGDRLAVVQALAARALEQGGCLMIDVHDYVFDEILYPDHASTYRGLLEYLCASSDVWVDTPGRIAEHWQARYHLLTTASYGLTGDVVPAGSLSAALVS